MFKIGTKTTLEQANSAAVAWHTPGCFPWKTVQTLLQQLCPNISVCQQPGLEKGGDILGEMMSWFTVPNLQQDGGGGDTMGEK